MYQHVAVPLAREHVTTVALTRALAKVKVIEGDAELGQRVTLLLRTLAVNQEKRPSLIRKDAQRSQHTNKSRCRPELTTKPVLRVKSAVRSGCASIALQIEGLTSAHRGSRH